MLTDPNILQSIWLTLKLAAITTMLLLFLSTPLAWWLSRTNSLLAHSIQVVVNLPLVLPPTVLGFYLLVLLGPSGPLGHLTLSMGWGTLPFTFAGLVVGSLIYSLPFAVQPLQNAFLAIGARPMEVAMTLRASPFDAFVSVILPLARPGFLVAAILSFAHTVGEFGIVLMMGGNIPGATQVVSTQIYSFVESMDYVNANYLAVFMLAFCFVVLLATSLLTKGGKLRLISS
jgi:molybdate transport system permease protein